MRLLVGIFAVLAWVGTAFAGYPPADIVDLSDPVPCNMTHVCFDWDFTIANQGFSASICETGGLSTWQYGSTSYIPGAPGPVWGTTLAGAYPNYSGDGLQAPVFTVTADCYLVEIYHYFDIENGWDGANLKVNGTLVTPQGGYTGTTYSYAYCVDSQQAWFGASGGWRTDCFDLSQYIGQSVALSFQFGSDGSVTYAGWYIAYVKVGGMGPSPTKGSTWGKIKGLFQ
jgi:hypothetical protein